MSEKFNLFELKIEKLREYTSNITCTCFFYSDRSFIFEYSPTELKVIRGNLTEQQEKALHFVLREIIGNENSKTHQKFNGYSIRIDFDEVDPKKSTWKLIQPSNIV